MRKPIRVKSGNKVGWEVYELRYDAELRAKRAIKEAKKKAERGYDFGYQSPGTIRRVDDGFEVCIP